MVLVRGQLAKLRAEVMALRSKCGLPNLVPGCVRLWECRLGGGRWAVVSNSKYVQLDSAIWKCRVGMEPMCLARAGTECWQPDVPARLGAFQLHVPSGQPPCCSP
jgi:hypothetical protein